MPKVEVKHPDKKAVTGAYSAGVLIDGWLHVSGHGPLDMTTGQPVPGTIEDQTRLTLTHIGKVLAEAGMSFDDVVKCTVHLADIGEFDRYNKVYSEFFTGVRPARTTVQSVLWGGIKVEIDCVARKSS
jgi:2-iminobutanoate/2-iminopropanoate deaminase